jgi:hypothetical protein
MADTYHSSRKASRLAIFAVVVIAVVLGAGLLIVIVSDRGCCGVMGPTPSSLGMIGGTPTTAACGMSTDTVYDESVSITSTSGSTITTNTLGLKILPMTGGPGLTRSTPGAWTASGDGACPTAGWWVELTNSAGSPLAWYQSACSQGLCWSATQNGTSVISAATISQGQHLIVYMIGQSPADPAGAYVMQSIGLENGEVSGSVDL